MSKPAFIRRIKNVATEERQYFALQDCTYRHLVELHVLPETTLGDPSPT